MRYSLFLLALTLVIAMGTISYDNGHAESVKTFQYELCNEIINIPYASENATVVGIIADHDFGSVILEIDANDRRGSLEITLPLLLIAPAWQFREHVFSLEDLFVVDGDGEIVYDAEITLVDDEHFRVSTDFSKGTDYIEIAGGNPTMTLPSWAYTHARPDKHSVDAGDAINFSASVIPRVAEYGDTITIYAKHYFDGTELFKRTLALEEFTNDGNFVLSVDIPNDAKSGTYSLFAELSALDDCGNPIKETLELSSVSFDVRGGAFFPVGTIDGKKIMVHMSTNSTTYGISLNLERKTLSMVGVNGEIGTVGTTRIIFQHEVLDGELDATIDGKKTDFTLERNSTHSTITVTYPHIDTERRVEITGTTVIPEFPHTALIIFSSVVLLAVITRLMPKLSHSNDLTNK